MSVRMSSTSDGNATSRTDGVRKCSLQAIRAGVTSFALTNGSCFLFATYGTTDPKRYTISNFNATSCPGGGKGLSLPNGTNIYNAYQVNQSLVYSPLGCWQDGPNPPIRYFTNISSSSPDPVAACLTAAQTNYYTPDLKTGCLTRPDTCDINVFGIQRYQGNQTVLKCVYGSDVVPNGTYSFYGSSSTCSDSGTGSTDSISVYWLKGSPITPAMRMNPSVYRSFGCFNAPENGDRWFDEGESTVERDVGSCAAMAAIYGRSVIYFRYPKCWFGSDFVPGGFYTRYGASLFCPTDGLGTSNIANVYLTSAYPTKNLGLSDLPGSLTLNRTKYSSLGCFDYEARIGSIAVQDPKYPNIRRYAYWRAVPDVSFRSAAFPKVTGPDDCYQQALARGHNIFAVIEFQYCYTTLDAVVGGNYSTGYDGTVVVDSYQDATKPRLGLATLRRCPSQMGIAKASFERFFLPNATTQNIAQSGEFLGQVFKVNSLPNTPNSTTQSTKWSHLGCYVTPNNMTSNEGAYSILDGIPSVRLNAIQKCYQVAKLRSHTVFAMRNGGECLSSTNVTLFTQYGSSRACLNDLRGATSWTYIVNNTGLAAITKYGAGVNVFRVLA